MEAFVKFLIRIYFTVFYRAELVGRENVPKHGAAVLCANHIGQMDMFFIGYRLKRLVHYMAKEELFRNPFVSAFIRRFGAFPVKRGTGDIGAIKTALHLLKEGKIIGILPEGTRTLGKESSKIKPKPGAAMIAIKAKVPVIPVAIQGNYKLFSKVRVIYGKPYYLDSIEDKKLTTEELTEISGGIMGKIYCLMEVD